MPASSNRRLAAVMCLDAAGYSRLMEVDEEGTLRRLKALRRDVLDPRIGEFAGRIVKTTGDGLLVEFASPVEAVRCAIALQQDLAHFANGEPAAKRLQFRIGINLGDVIADGDDLFGDGVNVAARLEGLAQPGGICVSRSVRDQIRDRLAIDLHDLGEVSVKNLARPVRVFSVALPGASDRGRAEGAAVDVGLDDSLSLLHRPSIAVLPFTNMSGDAEQEYFSDGVTEEIITALTSWRWIYVIARNSTFIYKGKPVDVREVGRELGVRYVLEGSVRKSGSRVRITAQLIEAASGSHLWTDRYDGSLDDIFDLQDQIAQQVAAAIEPAMTEAEGRRLGNRPTDDLRAFDLLLRGKWHLLKYTREDSDIARQLLQKAIAADPKLASAWCWLSRSHLQAAMLGWTEDVDATRAEGLRAAQKAIELDDKDSLAHCSLALYLSAHAKPGGSEADERARHTDALAAANLAVSLNPNFSYLYAVRGVANIYAGNLAAGIEDFQVSMRLNPKDVLNFQHWRMISMGFYLSRRYEDGLAASRKASQMRPSFYTTYQGIVLCSAQLGDMGDATRALDRIFQLRPNAKHDIREMIARFARPEDRAHLFDGFAKAGLSLSN